ncbi:MAG: AI-2E family transporter [Methylocapsa sp.]|nr:AI-2E family transporter [Methylocapsa sp.]
MRGDTVNFFKRAVIFVSVALVPILVWYLFDVLLIGMGAILIAELLEVGAEPFGWIRLPRWLALILSALIIVCVVGGTIYLFGRGVASELQEVIHRVEVAKNTIDTMLRGSGLGKAILQQAQSINIPITKFLGQIFGGGISFLAGIVVAVFAGVYLAAQPSLYREGFGMLFPPQRRAYANEMVAHLGGALRLWLLGQLIEMVIIGVLSGFAVWLIGLPSPVALGVIAGVAEFVPYLGPILAAIPALLVAVTVNLAALLWTLLAYVLIHQAEGHLVMPLIQRRMVHIPPAVMLMSIVTLSFLFGPLAIVFAAPITVVLFVLVAKVYVRDRLEEKVPIPGEPAVHEPVDHAH